MPLVSGGGALKSRNIVDDKFALNFIERRRSNNVLIKKPIPPAKESLLQQIFDGFDYNRSGEITSWDFKKALYYIYDESEEGKNARRHEQERKHREISDMVDVIDDDGSGAIDFGEFCEFMTNEDSGFDIAKLTTTFVDFQRGVQLEMLHKGNAEGLSRHQQMTVSDSMKCFEFLFKTHMAGAGSGDDEEKEAMKHLDREWKKYNMTKSQRAKAADVLNDRRPRLFIGTTTDVDVDEAKCIEEYGFYAMLCKPFDASKFHDAIARFKEEFEIDETEQWGRLLVSDVNPVQLSLITRELASQGYPSETTNDGKFVLDRLSRERFDIIILDTHMKGVNGYEVMQFYKRKKEREEQEARQKEQNRLDEERQLIEWAKKMVETPLTLNFASTHAHGTLTHMQKEKIHNNTMRDARHIAGPLMPMSRSHSGTLTPIGCRPVSLPGDEILQHKRNTLLVRIMTANSRRSEAVHEGTERFDLIGPRAYSPTVSRRGLSSAPGTSLWSPLPTLPVSPLRLQPANPLNMGTRTVPQAEYSRENRVGTASSALGLWAAEHESGYSGSVNGSIGAGSRNAFMSPIKYRQGQGQGRRKGQGKGQGLSPSKRLSSTNPSHSRVDSFSGNRSHSHSYDSRASLRSEGSRGRGSRGGVELEDWDDRSGASSMPWLRSLSISPQGSSIADKTLVPV